MNKIMDTIISTQMSCTIAYGAMIGAHLVERHANENWQFAIYVLLAIGVLFMLFPYLFMDKSVEENEHKLNRIASMSDTGMKYFNDATALEGITCGMLSLQKIHNLTKGREDVHSA